MLAAVFLEVMKNSKSSKKTNNKKQTKKVFETPFSSKKDDEDEIVVDINAIRKKANQNEEKKDRDVTKI